MVWVVLGCKLVIETNHQSLGRTREMSRPFWRGIQVKHRFQVTFSNILIQSRDPCSFQQFPMKGHWVRLVLCCFLGGDGEQWGGRLCSVLWGWLPDVHRCV